MVSLFLGRLIYTLTWRFRSWKFPPSKSFFHLTVGHQLKQHWHINTAGRFFLASRQGLNSSLITQGSPLQIFLSLHSFSLDLTLVTILPVEITPWWSVSLTLMSCIPSAQLVHHVICVYWQAVFAYTHAHSLGLLCVIWLKVGCPYPERLTKSPCNRVGSADRTLRLIWLMMSNVDVVKGCRNIKM